MKDAVVIEVFSWITVIAMIFLVHVGIAHSAEVTLQWEANKEPDIVGYKVYKKASTDKKWSNMTTLHKQTSVTFNVDGRRNWSFYVTVRNAVMESRSSNNVKVNRGY
jgi:hypothetical protein